MYNSTEVKFTFEDNDNFFIAVSNKDLFEVLINYDIEQVEETHFHIRKKESRHNMDYQSLKDLLRDFAIEWQLNTDRFNYTYDNLVLYQGFFKEYGKKYGLLREFEENGICNLVTNNLA